MAGELVGQRQLSEVLYQREQKRRALQDQQHSSAFIEEVEEPQDVAMNAAPVSDEDLNSILSPEDVASLKQALDSLELENAVQRLLEHNCRALKRLEELQKRRLTRGGAKAKLPEEDSEEWETGALSPILVS